MKSHGIIEWMAWGLVMLGGSNWLFIGLFRLDIISLLFGEFTLLTRTIYIIVGLAALYLIHYVLIKKTTLANLKPKDLK